MLVIDVASIKSLTSIPLFIPSSKCFFIINYLLLDCNAKCLIFLLTAINIVFNIWRIDYCRNKQRRRNKMNNSEKAILASFIKTLFIVYSAFSSKIMICNASERQIRQ